MSGDEVIAKLPETIANAVPGIHPSWVPATVKALDRLVGAAIEIPAAWLNQQSAKIDAKTESYRIVESAVASSAANVVCNDPEIALRAADNLLRKEYRKQRNKEAIAAVTLAELRSSANAEDNSHSVNEPEQTPPQLDDDWLNVFERYAEDVSSENMQRLWGRVLAGEIRKSGRYSLRTLRFLAEFSQEDARIFSEVANCVFGSFGPSKLINPKGKNVGHLLPLEANGILQGITALGLSQSVRLSPSGYGYLREGDIVIALWGRPNSEISTPCCVLSPLGMELLSLLPERDVVSVARRVAMSILSPNIRVAKLGVASPDNSVSFFETLWEQKNTVMNYILSPFDRLRMSFLFVYGTPKN